MSKIPDNLRYLFERLEPSVLKRHGLLSYAAAYTDRFPEVRKKAVRVANIHVFVMAEIYSILSDKEVPHFFAKGVVSSFLIFGDISVRPGKDIDIFIKKGFYRSALDILFKNGFSSDIPDDVIRRLYIPFGASLTLYAQRAGMKVTVDMHCASSDWFGYVMPVRVGVFRLPVPDSSAMKKFLEIHAEKHRNLYGKDILDIMLIENGTPDISLLEKKLSRTPTEGGLKDYLEAFLQLSVQAKFRFIIRHVFLPYASDIDIIRFRGCSVYLYFIIKPFSIILSLWRRLLTE